MKLREVVELGWLIYGQTQTLNSSKHNSERNNAGWGCSVKAVGVKPYVPVIKE